jgi:hypothetical protein
LTFPECESAIVEGNRIFVVSKKSQSYFDKELIGQASNAVYTQRERLFRIKIDPKNKKITFDSYSEDELVAQKLLNFTKEMKQVDAMIHADRVLARKKIFAKVDENIKTEIDNIAVRLEQDEGNF